MRSGAVTRGAERDNLAGVTDERLKRVSLMLAVASVLCGGMAISRALYSGGGTYLFLGWNLVLAWVPLALSMALIGGWAKGRLGRWLLVGTWFLFFPNAPYMVTDLIHLRPRAPVPLWFDAVMIFCFAMTALCLAFVSLFVVHRVVEQRRGRAVGWSFVGLISLFTGFGVYLGRFQRWNSWDPMVRPGAIVADLAGRVLSPPSHPRTLAVTFVVAAMFGTAYLVLFTLAALRSADSDARF